MEKDHVPAPPNDGLMTFSSGPHAHYQKQHGWNMTKKHGRRSLTLLSTALLGHKNLKKRRSLSYSFNLSGGWAVQNQTFRILLGSPFTVVD